MNSAIRFSLRRQSWTPRHPFIYDRNFISSLLSLSLSSSPVLCCSALSGLERYITYMTKGKFESQIRNMNLYILEYKHDNEILRSNLHSYKFARKYKKNGILMMYVLYCMYVWGMQGCTWRPVLFFGACIDLSMARLFRSSCSRIYAMCYVPSMPMRIFHIQ